MLYAKWKEEDVVICGKTIIKKGEVREIHAKSGCDNKYILKGQNGIGYLGWVSGDRIQILKSIDGGKK